MNKHSTYSYFSMEIALTSSVPTYAGGLGVLAGDVLRSAADLGVPMVGVTFVHRKGYFRQRLSTDGWQTEHECTWPVEDLLEECGPLITVQIGGERVFVRAWRFFLRGSSGHEVPVVLLDTHVPGNSDYHRTITDHLYGGDRHYRLCQEIVLGIGGVRILRALGYHQLTRFHLNEGHAAFAVLELMREAHARQGRAQPHVPVSELLSHARSMCIFTTHTPVEAGHDRFDTGHVHSALEPTLANYLAELDQTHTVNMTEIALRGSLHVNAVAFRHAEVSRKLFPNYPLRAITNGVHVGTWTAPAFQELYDELLPGWRKDSFLLRHARTIPLDLLWNAHLHAKDNLLAIVNGRADFPRFDRGLFTIGFARRATGYKRALLLFHDTERLRELARRFGRLQIIMSGKAHPHDTQGKEIIQKIIKLATTLTDEISVAYLENYDMAIAGALVAGVDLWLNTPQPPLEASGTSGMKAALNGVPSLSTLDGWWIEGCVEGVTGWSIGTLGPADTSAPAHDAADAEALYRRLEHEILPLFFDRPDAYREVMRGAIAINGSYFNSERMVQEYLHFVESGARDH